MGRAALVVSVGILASRALGWVRQLVILGLLGLGPEASLYTNAFLIPDYLTFLMAGGYLSITLVPLLTRHLATGDEAGALRTFTAVFRVVGVAFAALAVITVLLAGQIVGLLFPEVADQERLTSLTRIALASQVFFGLGTLLMAAQYARRSFTIPSLAPLVYNLAIIGGGAVGWLAGNPSPESFLWGGLAGAAVGNLGIQWLGARRVGFRLIGGVPWRHPAIGEYFVLAFPLMVGLSAVALDEQWPRLFGQFAGRAGAEAALTSARQLNMLPVGMIAQAAGVAAYPFLASLAAEGKLGELGATVTRSVRSAAAIGGAAAGLVAGLAVPAVAVAYEHGEIDDGGSRFIASLLLWFSLSIPFWPAHQVYTRGFYAMRRMWTPVVVGSVTTALVVPLLVVLVRVYGAVGVAAGSTAGVALYTVAIGATWHLKMGAGEAGRVVATGIKVAVAAAASALAGRLVSDLVPQDGLMAPVALAAGGMIGIAVYLGVAHLLRMEELDLARIRSALSRR